MTASGGFTTNGVGGTVYYSWVRYDSNGNITATVSETPIRVAAGDKNFHAVASDSFAPQHSGSERLVFSSPAYSVNAQSWTCAG